MSMSEFMTPMSSGRNSGQMVNKSMIYPSSSQQKKKIVQGRNKPVNLVPLAKSQMRSGKMSKTVNYGKKESKNNFAINPVNFLQPNS
jgi:hypothetical protein